VKRALTVAGLVGVVALSVAVPIGRDLAGALRLTPTCQEDEVLVGEGAFDGARWTRYVCGPALDDLVDTGETISNSGPMVLADSEVR
jgi:hypothetical protein